MKPYTCTYPGCAKRFGSKNDWKRHENSQHFQLECWKCNENDKDSPDEICGRVSNRRETFTAHLENDHGLDQTAIEGKLRACRVGRNSETRFWCGFCETDIEFACAERFNHIDEHFSGKNGRPKVDMSMWKTAEDEPSEPIDFLLPSLRPQGNRSQPLSPEQSRKRRQSQSGFGSFGVRRKKPRIEDGELFWSCVCYPCLSLAHLVDGSLTCLFLSSVAAIISGTQQRRGPRA